MLTAAAGAARFAVAGRSGYVQPRMPGPAGGRCEGGKASVFEAADIRIGAVMTW